jgi:CheY-like chemotaxis protein
VSESGIAQRTSSSRPAVLIVDDDLDLQRVLTKFLTLEGFDSMAVGNGQDALVQLRSGGRVDVVLLDLRMPLMDGWAFRRAQRADPAIASIPVIVLSGTEAERVDELAAAAWFSKPVSFVDVIEAIRRLTSSPSA